MKTFYNDLRLIRLSGREEIREPELKLSLTSQTLINIILSEDCPVFVIVIVYVIVIVIVIAIVFILVFSLYFLCLFFVFPSFFLCLFLSELAKMLVLSQT